MDLPCNHLFYGSRDRRSTSGDTSLLKVCILGLRERVGLYHREDAKLPCMERTAK